MPLEDYRYYRLDGAGHLHDAEWFQAKDDVEALALIVARHPDSSSEVWQGRRLVGRLSPGPRLKQRSPHPEFWRLRGASCSIPVRGGDPFHE